MAENDYYEEPNASHGEFRPNYDQFGKGNTANNLPPRDNRSHEKGKEAGTVKVEQGYVINLPLCNLHKRKVLELKECYIVLYEHFLVYKIVGKYEVFDDELEVWKEQKCNFRWTRMRKDLTDVNMYYDNPDDVYAVAIEFCGKNEQTWHWAKGADAKKFHDIMQNYFVTRDQKLDDEQTNMVP